MLTEKQHRNFWSKVRVNAATGCWEWTACRNRRYGGFQAAGKLMYAHRVAYVLQAGVIPDGLCVCHKCDNTLCVRGDHLFLGTAADNNKDRALKGRSCRTPGELRWSAKLTEAEVLAIRASTKTHRELAVEYGISNQQVSRIISRKRWAHL